MEPFDQAVLSAVQTLGDNAYGVTIRQSVETALNRFVSYGSIYVALGRLEEAGLVTSHLREAAPERGARPKRYYTVGRKQ